jgi:hypothetical protein
MSLAVAATAVLTYADADATNGKVVIVGSVTYALKTGSLAAAGDVAIVAGKPDSTIRNLANAINADGGVVGTDYYPIAANSAASAAHDPFDNALVVTARVSGTAGNLIALTTDEPEFTVLGSTLAGGVAGDSVASYSLLTLEELKLALRVRGSGFDAMLIPVAAAVADMVEQELEFRCVADDGTADAESDVVEYHDLANNQGFVYLRRIPVRSITTVYKVAPDGTETAVAASGYTIESQSGLLTLAGGTASVAAYRRLSTFDSGSGMWPEDSWRLQASYFRAGTTSARVIYKGGFADTASVPGGLKDVAADMAARIYRIQERKSQNLSSEVTQGLGLATKYDQRVITDDHRARLRPYKTLTKTARHI